MMNFIEPKEFQIECVDNVFKMICEGKRRISILIPAGGGKTLMATMLAKKICPTYQKALFLTDTICVKEQCENYVESLKVNNFICDTVEHFLLEGGDYELVVLLDVRPAVREKLEKHFAGDFRTIIVSLGVPLFESEKEIVCDFMTDGIMIERRNSQSEEKANTLTRLAAYYTRMGGFQPLVYATQNLIDVRDIFIANNEEKDSIVEQIESDKNRLSHDISALEDALEEMPDVGNVEELKETIARLQMKVNYQTQLLVSVGIPQNLVDEEFGKIEKLRAELEPYFYDENNNIVESVMAQFETVVAESVAQLTKKIITLENKERYEDILKEQLTENVWDKLSDTSKSFLVTAKMNYESMIKFDDKNELDYSGVCLLITKVLDIEIARRLYEKYADYLRQNYTFDIWPTSMLNKDRNDCLENKNFTLGTVMYVIGCDVDGNIKNNYVYNKFKEFAHDELYRSSLSSQEQEQRIKNIVKYVEKVRVDYRNPAAHRNSLNAISAEACMGYMIETYRKLKEILEDMNY